MKEAPSLAGMLLGPTEESDEGSEEMDVFSEFTNSELPAEERLEALKLLIQLVKE